MSTLPLRISLPAEPGCRRVDRNQSRCSNDNAGIRIRLHNRFEPIHAAVKGASGWDRQTNWDSRNAF
jgi:hypothetical protein